MGREKGFTYKQYNSEGSITASVAYTPVFMVHDCEWVHLIYKLICSVLISTFNQKGRGDPKIYVWSVQFL